MELCEIHLVNGKAVWYTRDRLSRRRRARLMPFERDGEIYFTSAATHTPGMN